MSIIEQDIRNWSRGKLSQWALDTLLRYDAGEVRDSRALSNMVMDLWIMAATILADADANHVEAGIKFATLLREMRVANKAMDDREKEAGRERQSET